MTRLFVPRHAAAVPRLAGVGLLAALLSCIAPRVQAALTENLGTSSTAMSLGNAVTADPPGIESIHFNPAGLARLKGKHRQDSVFGASTRPYASFRQPEGFDIGGWTVDPVAGKSTGPTRQMLYIPGYGPLPRELPAAAATGIGFSYNAPGSPFTFASLVYVPQAVSIDRTKDPNDPGRFDGRQVLMQRMVYLSPSVGYRFSDTLSFGLAVPIAHQSMILDTDMRFPNKFIGIIGKLQDGWCGDRGSNPLDALGPGLCGGGQEGRLRPFNKAGNMRFEMTAPTDLTYNLGVLWEPREWFAFGAVYQSGSKTVLTGKYNFEAEPMFRRFVQGLYSSLQGPLIGAVFGLPTSIPENQGGNMTSRIPFPQHAQLGIKLKPVSRLQINADIGWTDWAAWNAFTFQFDQQVRLLETARIFGQSDPSKLVIPRNARSNWTWGIGLQWQVTDRIRLQAGYEPRRSSIPQNAIDLVAPLPDVTAKSLGVNVKIDEDTEVQMGASFLSGRFDVPANGSCNLNCDNFFNVIYNPYAGLDVSGGIRIRYFGMTLRRKL